MTGNVELNRSSLQLYEAAILQFSFQPGQTKNLFSCVGAQSILKDSNRVGRSYLALPHTPLAVAGEAALWTPVSPPDESAQCGRLERLYGKGMEL